MWTVEPSVAKDESLERAAENQFFQLCYSGRGSSIKRGLFGIRPRTGSVCESDTLSHKPLRLRPGRGSDEVVGADFANPGIAWASRSHVCRTERLGQVRELMNNDLGLRSTDGLDQRIAIEDIDDGRLDLERSKLRRPGG
jgi:hypothetical protein